MEWTRCVEARPGAARRLICFPHAGGTPYYFRPWSAELDDTEVHTVCYPGRAERMAEPPATELVPLARSVAAALRPLLGDGGPRVELFGHSMGAIVAFETATALESGGGSPARLYASGARAPHLMGQGSGVSDHDVSETLAEIGGTDAELLSDPDFLEMVTPYVTADFRMLGGYRAAGRGPLRCPVTVLVGDRDPRVSRDQASAWRDWTHGEFRLHAMPGGHFYSASPREMVG